MWLWLWLWQSYMLWLAGLGLGLWLWLWMWHAGVQLKAVAGGPGPGPWLVAVAVPVAKLNTVVGWPVAGVSVHDVWTQCFNTGLVEHIAEVLVVLLCLVQDPEQHILDLLIIDVFELFPTVCPTHQTSLQWIERGVAFHFHLISISLTSG